MELEEIVGDLKSSIDAMRQSLKTPDKPLWRIARKNAQDYIALLDAKAEEAGLL